MNAQKTDPRFLLFKERQALEKEITKLERSFGGFYVEPQVLMGSELTPRQQAEEDLARKKHQLKLVNERLNSAAAQDEKRKKPIIRTKSLKRIKWKGNKFEFTQTILDLYDKGFIQATSRMNALKQASLHFVDRNGRTFSPRSLWQSYRTKLDAKSH